VIARAGLKEELQKSEKQLCTNVIIENPSQLMVVLKMKKSENIVK